MNQGLPAPAGPPTYEIEHDIHLIRAVKRLAFPWEMHHTVLPGTVGVCCFKGRLRDVEGRPNLYPPGTTIAYTPFAAPPWSDAAQHAIIISQGAQRVKIAVHCPLPGLTGDSVTIIALLRFEVTDPLRLVERMPGWEEPGGLARLNEAVVRDVRDAVEGVIRHLTGTLTVRPEWLTPSGAEGLRERIIAAVNLSEWGLSLLSEQPPLASLEYPPSLLEALHDLYAAYILWQDKLAQAQEPEREALADRLGLEEGDIRASLLAGVAPPFDGLVRRRPDLLEAIVAEAGSLPQDRSQTLRSLLRNPANGWFYSELVAGLLRDWQGPQPFFRSVLAARQRPRGAWPSFRETSDGASKNYGHPPAVAAHRAGRPWYG